MRRLAVLAALVLIAVLAVAPATRTASPDTALAAEADDLRDDVAALKRQVRALRASLQRNRLRDYCSDALAFAWISDLDERLIANRAAGFLSPTIAFPDPPGRLDVTPTCTTDARTHPLVLATLWPRPPKGGPLIP